MQRTVFVDRARRHQTGDAIAEIVARLASGTSVVLFAEGTSSDGNRVLPFRSALVGAAEEAAQQAAAFRSSRCRSATPASMAFRWDASNRPLVAWYGDLDFMPHIKAFIARGAVDAVVSYGEPLAADSNADRKAMAKTLQSTVRAITTATLRGQAAQRPGDRVSSS